MPSYPNIEKSKLRSGEYVGYGAGRVWRIRKLNKWHAMAMLPASRDRDFSMPDLAAYKLADISAQLVALSIESGKLLPAVDFPITLIGDPGHAAAQAETVRRLTKRIGQAMRESDIMHEAGAFWVLRERASYVVCRNVGTHSTSDSAYAKTADGLSIAIARCDYLAGRTSSKA